MDTLEQRIEATERILLRTCEEQGFIVAGDRSVCEADAERLLGYRPGALRKQRSEDVARIPHRRIAGKWRFRLADLAAAFESDFEG